MNNSQITGLAVAREFADGQDGDYSEYSFCCGAKYIGWEGRTPVGLKDSQTTLNIYGEKVAKTYEIYKSAVCSECKSSEHTGR